MPTWLTTFLFVIATASVVFGLLVWLIRRGEPTAEEYEQYRDAKARSELNAPLPSSDDAEGARSETEGR